MQEHFWADYLSAEDAQDLLTPRPKPATQYTPFSTDPDDLRRAAKKQASGKAIPYESFPSDLFQKPWMLQTYGDQLDPQYQALHTVPRHHLALIAFRNSTNLIYIDGSCIRGKKRYGIGGYGYMILWHLNPGKLQNQMHEYIFTHLTKNPGNTPPKLWKHNAETTTYHTVIPDPTHYGQTVGTLYMKHCRG